MSFTRHLGVALELRVEIDRLLALHARLSSESCGYEIVKTNYQKAVKEALHTLARAEAKALHLHQVQERG